MRRLISISIVIFTICFVSAYSQFKQGDWELGFTGSLGTYHEKYESNYYSNYYSDTYDMTYLIVSFIPGYYITNGLSFEPEIGLVSLDKGKPGLVLLGNISFSHFFAKDKFALFMRAGYGRTNSVSLPGVVNFNGVGGGDLDIDVINAGAGMKFLIGTKALIRMEANYRNFFAENHNAHTISLIFGLGLIL
jgi:hypothetical protein